MHTFYALRLGLMESATETPGPTSGAAAPVAPAAAAPGSAEAPAAGTPPAATLTIGQRLKAAATLMTGAGGSSVADLQAKIAELTTQLTQANARIAQLEADAKEAEAALTAIETESAKLKAKEQDLAKRTAAGVKHEVAALGFPAAKLPAGGDLNAPTTLTYADALAEYGKIADHKARADYYARVIQPMLDRRS